MVDDEDSRAEVATRDRNSTTVRMGYTIATAIGAAVGTAIARKALAMTWQKTTGKAPPAKGPEQLEAGWAEAAAWVAISAAAAAVARLAAHRRIAATWQRASGQPPPVKETFKV
jgi:hypothetical protein